MIIINENLLESICQHVRQTYPHECCGLLIGKNNPRKEVFESHPVTNLNTEHAHDRYELDPKEFQRLEDHARLAGLSILGIYHSHPDHPCAPSEVDTQAAWGAYQFTQEVYSYLIVSIENAEKIKITSWILNGKGVFEEEKIVKENREDS